MQVGILPAAPLPDSVKVARRPVKPRGVGASPTLAANFWKAGRYKLAAPVLKTGSVHTEVGALPTPSASLNHNQRQSHETDYPLPNSVALSQELQTKSNNSNATGRKAEPRVPPLARRSAN